MSERKYFIYTAKAINRMGFSPNHIFAGICDVNGKMAGWPMVVRRGGRLEHAIHGYLDELDENKIFCDPTAEQAPYICYTAEFMEEITAEEVKAILEEE